METQTSKLTRPSQPQYLSTKDLTYFVNRSPNASSESQNANIKAFIGVKNIEFFLINR
tara:strand:+ start:347 stop:520 length:174 start_codon:yes stop_codon:yes gene_type:complete